MNLSALFGTGLSTVTPLQVLLTLLMAFVLGHIIAWVFEWTYEGLSYSRTFMQSLVLAPLVAALLMLAIGDNLARGLGIMGTMALVRFRTNVRDTRDMIFVFATLAVGVACGVRAYTVAIVSTLFFSFAALSMYWTPFAKRQIFEGMLRFWLPKDAIDAQALRDILTEHCATHVLVTLRDIGRGDLMEYAWQIRLRKPTSREDLVHALAELPDIGGLTLMLQDAHTEI